MKRRLGLPELVVSNVRLLGHLRLPSDMKLTSSEKVRAEGALAGIAAQDLNESSGACKPLSILNELVCSNMAAPGARQVDHTPKVGTTPQRWIIQNGAPRPLSGCLAVQKVCRHSPS